MAKTAIVRARINPQTKALADKVLSKYGLTHSAFINLSYHSLIHDGSIPISRHIPTDELATSLRASRNGETERKTHADIDRMKEIGC